MVEHEVVWSRKRELDDFGTGLDMLGLQTILRQNPEVCSSLLCHSDSSFGPEQFEQCLNRATDPDDFVQSQAYGWFNTYIGENPKSEFYQGGCRLKALLHFSTGFQVPPLVKVFQRSQFIFYLMMMIISFPQPKLVLVIQGCQLCTLQRVHLMRPWTRL